MGNEWSGGELRIPLDEALGPGYRVQLSWTVSLPKPELFILAP
jgi:hypothetical protein